MDQPVTVLLGAWIAEEVLHRLSREFPQCRFLQSQNRQELWQWLGQAEVVYGLPPLEALAQAGRLRWLQLNTAGVPMELCNLLRGRQVVVSNLAGLYGPSIAEHVLGLMLVLARNLHQALRQQVERQWRRELSGTMSDLRGRTAAILGLGNIGQNTARLCRALGMQVIGCRRTPRATPFVDRVFPREQVQLMLPLADYVIVTVPLTRETRGMLGPQEFAAMKPGAFYLNVSRGAVACEDALVEALRSGRLAGAGLDVFATEPLPADHPLWEMPQVVITPHCSGETVNRSPLPGERFLRNLRRYLAGEPVEARVDLELGY
jgi:phosphoglycerate dehydrogenase-like enzyme